MNLVDQFGEPIHSAPPRERADSGDIIPRPGWGWSGYEGAQLSDNRTAFLAFPMNVRRELNCYTRREIVRKVRALDSNLGIFSRIRSKIGQHAVGKGCFVRPLTRDKEWNESNRKRYEKRSENPLLYSTEETYDLYEDQRFAAETMVSDGEYFEALVTKNKRRCVQRFDAFEIRSPWGSSNFRLNPTEPIWRDGVRTDDFDAPILYGVAELPDELSGFGWAAAWKVREIPAISMMHLFQHRRAHQGRGLSWFYSGINNGIDALDVIALEKGAAKLHSLLALAVRKKKGDATTSSISGQIQKVLGPNKEITRVNENFWRGAAITYLAEDEGIDLLSSERPTPNLLAFLEFLYRDIAIGLGIPLEIVYKLQELGGATLRGALEDAQWLFDCVQDKVVMRHSQRHYVWDTACAMKSGEQPLCKDPEWWVTAWRGPAKLTVDLGRTAQAAVLLMKNAALSHVRYYDERAQDAYSEMQEEIDFLAWLKERCEAAGVDIKLLLEPTPGANPNTSVSVGDPGDEEKKAA